MKKSLGMWLIVIGIIVVGVSVTRATKEFVSSNRAESAAITSVMDISQNDAEEEDDSEGEAAESETEYAEKLAEIQENTGRSRRILDEPQAEEAIEETEEGITEAVKSPLDPAVETEGAYLQIADEITLTAEDFKNRFETAEAAAEGFGGSKGPDGNADQAAEQEYRLWDYELNLIYGTIRERMSQDEADELKLLELEWMKERDLYADKALAVNKGVSAKSAEYLKRMTEKTKERCYWLAEQYESVLDREKLK